MGRLLRLFDAQGLRGSAGYERYRFYDADSGLVDGKDFWVYLWISCEAETGELPASGGGEEVAIRCVGRDFEVDVPEAFRAKEIR